MSDQRTLLEVQQLFQEWRSQKKKGKAFIPIELWEQAAGLVGRHSLSEVYQRLAISPDRLKEFVAARDLGGNSIPSTQISNAPSVTFVNVTPLLSVEQKPMMLEFKRRDGTTATCHCPDKFSLRDTLSWFLAGGV